MRIAQISDLHLRGPGNSNAREFDAYLIDCIAHVNAAAPDIVIATGDLTDSGTDEEYRRLRELMNTVAVPWYVLPGNHDDPEALRRVFDDRPYLFQTATHLSYALDAGKWLLLLLDSTKDGRPGGYLDLARLEWLASQLDARPGVPTVLALHHPPFAAGVWPMDWLGFVNVRELERVVASHRQIRRIVSGHVHCARTASWGGTFACTSPSTRSQRLLIGVGWRPPVPHFERAGFLMHELDDTGAAVTYVHRISGAVQRLG